MSACLRPLLLVIPALLVGASARAQVLPSSADTSRTYTLGEVSVEGERPYSAGSDATFRAADFALQPRNSAQDILRIVPGLVIAQHAGGGKAEQIFLRGFDADHGTDVNLSVDGAPVNMVSHGHGQGYADLHFVMPDAVDRVDVYKGPYFARYGDLATAGAIVFGLADSLKQSLVKFEGGQFNTYRSVGLFKAPSLRPGLTAYFGGELFASDSYFEQSQAFKRLNLMARANQQVGDGALTATLLTFSSGWNASGQVPQRAVDSGLITRFGSIDPTEGGQTSRTTGILRYSSGGDTPFILVGSVTDYRFRLYSNFTLFAADSVRGDEIEQIDDRTMVSLRAEGARRWSLGPAVMRTRYGATLRNDDIAPALYHDSSRVRLETKALGTIRERQLGPYAEQEIVLPFAQILLGLRADYFSFDVENHAFPGEQPQGVTTNLLFSPKANLAVPLGRSASLFLNAGLGFHSNDARVAVRNEGRALPRAFGAEVGARVGHPGTLLALAVALWQLDLESEQVYIGDEGTTEPSGRTQRQGIDLEVQLQPLRHLGFGANLTVSRGRLRDEPDGANRIPLAPNVTLTANALAKISRGLFAVRLRLVGDRPANETNTVRAEGYAVTDLSASYPFGPLELYATVENLLDVTWNEAQFDTESRLRGEAEPISELHFTPGTPRSARAGVSFRF